MCILLIMFAARDTDGCWNVVSLVAILFLYQIKPAYIPSLTSAYMFSLLPLNYLPATAGNGTFPNILLKITRQPKVFKSNGKNQVTLIW